MINKERRHWLLHPLTISTLLTLIFGVTGFVLERSGFHTWSLPLYVLAYLAGGWYSTLEGIRALKDRQIEVDLLMVLAAAGAAALGYWEEGVSLLFLFSLSNALQEFAMDHTRRAVTSLMDLYPEEALVKRETGAVRVPVEELNIGDVVIIRPGDRIPVDGEVINGKSWVNEAAVTGESVPVTKTVGSPVFAGTVNRDGALEVKVTRDAGDTVLARIVRLVEQARSEKAATQERIDYLEQIYARAVLLVVCLAATIPLLFGAPTEPTIYRALTLMVVASPCAVAIAAPSGFLSAISAAARSGVLLKGARYLERLAEVDTVALDKTGTLTKGEPQVSAVIPKPGQSLHRVIQLAASVEAYAEHPFANAIVDECQRRGVPLLSATNVAAITGAGVQGSVDGHQVLIGRPELFGGSEAEPWLYEYSQRLLEHGHTVVWVGAPEPVGLIALHDAIRPEAAAMVSQLKRIGVKQIVMLTGDNEHVANAVARRVGIDQVYAGLLPEDKVEHIKRLTNHGTVAMVGDGINDSPALARAHVGIAMGAVGSDAALESADVVLVDDQLERIPFALQLGRRARKVVLQGLAFALAVIGVLMIGTLAGYVNLSLGVIGHEGSTIVVVISGLRLLLAHYRTGEQETSTGRLPAPELESVDVA